VAWGGGTDTQIFDTRAMREPNDTQRTLRGETTKRPTAPHGVSVVVLLFRSFASWPPSRRESAGVGLGKIRTAAILGDWPRRRWTKRQDRAAPSEHSRVDSTPVSSLSLCASVAFSLASSALLCSAERSKTVPRWQRRGGRQKTQRAALCLRSRRQCLRGTASVRRRVG
jgi:hypothetical protein